jgi:hypothetical protein
MNRPCSDIKCCENPLNIGVACRQICAISRFVVGRLQGQNFVEAVSSSSLVTIVARPEVAGGDSLQIWIADSRQEMVLQLGDWVGRAY